MSMIKIIIIIIRVTDFIVLLHENIALSWLSLKINHSVYLCLDDKPPLVQLLVTPEQGKRKTATHNHFSKYSNLLSLSSCCPIGLPVSAKGEIYCNLPLFTFTFFLLIERLLWNVLPLLTSACCFLQKLFFLGTPHSFDEAKKTNMEQTFRSMFFLCV